MEKIIWKRTTVSTNDDAKALALSGADAFCAAAAGAQTGGRGRFARPFYSPADLGLYISYVLRPGLLASQCQLLTAAAALAVCGAVAEASSLRPRIKWINDILISGKKICGILTESAADADGRLMYAIAGIGINLNHLSADFPPELQQTATSLRMESGLRFDPMSFAGILTRHMRNEFENDSFAKKNGGISSRYRELLDTLGKEIEFVKNGVSYSGTAYDTDENGGLCVVLENGEKTVLNSGEISVRLR